MSEEFHQDMAQFRKDGLLVVALYGSRHITYRIVVACYVFGGLCHLWLGDAWNMSWLFPNLLFFAGLVLLALRGAALGWFLAAAGKLLPLLFLRDHLNQSVIMAIVGIAGGIYMTHEGYQALRRGFVKTVPHPHGPITPGELGLFKVLRGVTMGTYFLAAMHKVNRDFFDRTLGCASYGVDKLVAYWNIPSDLMPQVFYHASPYAIIGVELAIPLLYLLGLRRLVWPLVVAFHIPLTLTMAPAFAFVMLAGHAAFLLPRDITALSAILRRHYLAIMSTAAAATALSLYAHQQWPDWTMIPREFLLWVLLGTMSLLLLRQGVDRLPSTLFSSPWLPASWQQALAATFVTLFIINGFSPYLGLRFQHTAAMVSSLRIDEGCWNSLIFPESLRISDNYIRVDVTYFNEPGFLEKYETIVLEQLWSPPQIRQMRRNWCRERLRPFYLEGTFRGRPFIIEDLCDGSPLPFRDDGVFGIEVFKDHLIFQKNLMRECPQKCIH